MDGKMKKDNQMHLPAEAFDKTFHSGAILSESWIETRHTWMIPIVTNCHRCIRRLIDGRSYYIYYLCLEHTEYFKTVRTMKRGGEQNEGEI